MSAKLVVPMMCVGMASAAPLWQSPAATLNISKFQQYLGDAQSLCRPLVYRVLTNSTMDLARRELQEGAPHGTLVVAEEQSAGRGRAGSKWRSPSEANLYFTILLLSEGDSSRKEERRAQINFASPLAVARAIKTVEPELEPVIRWPRTVEIYGSKVSGSLMEEAGDSNEHFALGIGVNVNGEICTDASLSQDVTSLRCLTHRLVDRERLLAEVCRRLEAYLSNYQTVEIKQEYLSSASSTAAPGAGISLWDKTGKSHITDGRVSDIASDMSLVVQATNGSTITLSENGAIVVFPKGRGYKVGLQGAEGQCDSE